VRAVVATRVSGVPVAGVVTVFRVLSMIGMRMIVMQTLCRRNPRRARPTAFPTFKEGACQHKCCHNNGVEAAGDHLQTNAPAGGKTDYLNRMAGDNPGQAEPVGSRRGAAAGGQDFSYSVISADLGRFLTLLLALLVRCGWGRDLPRLTCSAKEHSHRCGSRQESLRREPRNTQRGPQPQPRGT
jgi:hypothetical protein